MGSPWTQIHEWITHSSFSFLTGASSPDALIERAAQLGYASIAITDFDGVYGLARAHRAAIQHPALTLHYGAEIHLAAHHDDPVMLRDTLVLIAESSEGYANLCRLLTHAHEKGKQTAWIDPHALQHYPIKGLQAIIPMRGQMRRGDLKGFETHCRVLHHRFADALSLAVTITHHPAEDQWISATKAIADKTGIPLIITQDVFFHHPDAKPIHDVLTAIRTNQSLDAAVPHMWPNAERHLHSPADLQTIYTAEWVAGALARSNEMAGRIHFSLNELKYQYPKEWVPAGMTSLDYLKDRIQTHLPDRYPNGVPDTVNQLIDHELKLVNQLNVADYFLTVYDIVIWARSQSILCQGRGSAANSAICYVLGITALDPCQFELLFERFISVERGDPPDIDVDFEHERREAVIQYIYRRYGRRRAAMVCNVICFKSRGAIRATGLALAVPNDILTAAAQLLSSRSFRGSNSAELFTHLRQAFPDRLPDHTWTWWMRMAQAIHGFPRHLGIHSGGFIVSHTAITQLSPIEPATMPGRSVIQWSKDDIESLGFFKIDVLALGGLTLIRKCLDTIAQHGGPTLTLADIPLTDTATYTMIGQADTVGTFQIESRAQMAFLPRHLPKTFYDLVVQVAIIRPGPIQGGMIHPYLRRRRGEEAVSVPDPRLAPILNRTYGVPIFQEQVMRVAMAVGNFTPGQANELRRNLGAFTLNLAQSKWVNRLQDGMRANGIPDSFIDGIMGHIHGFASYGFPESHAASFALLAYITAYLKCHYPAHFFCSILNSLPMGFYPPDILVKTAQRCGVKVLPICIIQSKWDHQLEESANGKWAIRLGFRLIRGLRTITITHRPAPQSGMDGIMDLLQHHRLTVTDLTALAAANAFHALGLDRRAALWLADAAPITPLLDHLGPSIQLGIEDPLTQVEQDYAATSVSLGLHPATLMRSYAWVFSPSVRHLTFSDALRNRQLRANTRVVVFGMVSVRQSPPTAKGVVFITLWDETGSYDLIVSPTIYLKYRTEIDGQQFLCVQGHVRYRDSVPAISVTQVYAPTITQSSVVPFPTRRQTPFTSARNYM